MLRRRVRVGEGDCERRVQPVVMRLGGEMLGVRRRRRDVVVVYGHSLASIR